MKTTHRISRSNIQPHPPTVSKKKKAPIERVESAPDSPKGGFLGRLGSSFVKRSNKTTGLEAPLSQPASPDTKRRLSAGRAGAGTVGAASTKVAAKTESSTTNSRRPSSSKGVAKRRSLDHDNDSSSSLSLSDELQRLGHNSPTPKPNASSSNKSYLSLDETDLESLPHEEHDVSAEEHLNSSLAALQQFNYDSPRSSIRTPKYRTVSADDVATVELDDSSIDSHKKKKKDKKKKKTEKKVKPSTSSSKLSSLTKNSESQSILLQSPSSVMSSSSRLKSSMTSPMSSKTAGSTRGTASSHDDSLTQSPSSPRGRSPLRSPGLSSPHHRGVAPVTNHRRARRLSHLVGKPYIPKIVNTMKQDMMRIEQLEAQIKAVQERKQMELASIEDQRSKTMQKLRADYARKSQDIAGVSLPNASDLESNHKLADQLRRENAQIREHNQSMRTNCQNIRINNTRLEEKTVELAEYKTRLDAHHRRVSEEHDKLKAMDEQFAKEVQALQDEVDLETEKARYEHLNRARFERRIYEFVELIKLHDKDNKDLHRRIDAIVNVTDSQKDSWPPSSVDRNETKRQTASSRRASMRESL